MTDHTHHKMTAIGDLLADFIQGTPFEKQLLGNRIIAIWPDVMGSMVASMTGGMEVKEGVLYVHIPSSALRSQLFECRRDIVRKLNEAASAQIIHDIRLLA